MLQKMLVSGLKLNASTQLLLATALVGAVGCGQGSFSDGHVKDVEGLRSLTQAEAKEDLNQLVTSVKAYYGPLQYKEKRFGYKFDDLVAKAQAQVESAKTDAEIFGAYDELLTSLRDAHVGILFPSSSSPVSKFSIPIFVTPVEGHALVDSVDGSLKGVGIVRGDEVISVDGKAPKDYLPVFKKYKTYSNDVTDEHLIYMVFSRPFYMAEALPQQDTAKVIFKRADGSQYTRELVWRITKSPTSTSTVSNTIPARADLTVAGVDDFNDAAGASLQKMGSPTPYFANSVVESAYKFTKVTSDADYRKKYGLTDAQTPDIYAVLYQYQGKNVLLVRQPTYAPADQPVSNYMRAYAALLDQYQKAADVLVVDQTHNPGGNGAYCSAFYSLFAKGEANAPVEFVHADRKWIYDLKIDAQQGLKPDSELALALTAMGTKVEQAYDAGQFLTSTPLPIFTGSEKIEATLFKWSKPVLVLADELAGSCGDVFPMLIKGNQTAKIFGNRTIGAGGNVESIVTLPNSRASIHLTRGLFTYLHDDGRYPEQDLVENNGVQPDYPYTVSVKDFRSGFVEYVNAFSQKAVEQIAPQPKQEKSVLEQVLQRINNK